MEGRREKYGKKGNRRIERDESGERFFMTDVATLVFRDARLSFAAKGLYMQILSFADNWQITAQGLSECSSDGIKSVKSALKELQFYGYLTVEKERTIPDKDSEHQRQVIGYTYTVHERPEQK